MRVFAISDLHLSINNPKPMDIFGKAWEGYTDKIFADWNSKVSDEDIVLLAGDLSWAMKLEDAIPDLELISAQKGKKVLLRGNHDYWWSAIGKVRKVLPKNMYAVQNDAIRFDSDSGSVVVFGTRGWSSENGLPESDQKIYNCEVERLKLTISAAQKLREGASTVCMTHFPPFNAAKQDTEFTKLITEFKPTAVVYGHLHGKDCRKDLLTIKNEIPYYLTSCDLTANTLIEIPI